MEKYIVGSNIKVFGMEVSTFPEGIPQVFNSLMNKITDGPRRDYYGISYMTNDGKIFYFAATAEKENSEAGKYDLDSFTIEKGEYLVQSIADWKQKIDTINCVFHELMQDERIDKDKPCIEWYKSENEMWCMIGTKQTANADAGDKR
ncbi:MAG TPA: hypothetical protein VMT76_00580 [Puia sp.]|nr:hypothetical protein [Puia sp.]